MYVSAPTLPIIKARGELASKLQVAQAIRDEAIRQGVDPNVAVKIAYVESRFRTDARGPVTRHGRAQGILQVLPSSAEALEPGSSRYLLNPEVGIRVGIKHMASCMATGARTGAEIARCHVAGVYGWKVKLRRKAERYKWRYVAMYNAAPILKAGWAYRGEGSNNTRLR
jgi:hypothetical protein